MPRYTIQPEAFLPPSPFSPYFQVSFRLPFESRDPIYPASSLQLSFERSDDHQELFLEKRLTARDVRHNDAGVCTLRLDRDGVPKYALRRGQQTQQLLLQMQKQQMQKQKQTQIPDPESVLEHAADVLVKLHAWKGERHLGVWQVGTLRGGDIYKVVD